MLSVFLHPLLGRCKAKFCFRLPAFVCWPRGRFDFETFGLWIPKVSKSKQPRGLKGCSTASILVACASQPILAVVCARFATKGLVVVRECSVCMYAYVCMCACVCVHVCVCMRVCARVYLCVCMRIRVCMCVCYLYVGVDVNRFYIANGQQTYLLHVNSFCRHVLDVLIAVYSGRNRLYTVDGQHK